MRDIILTLLAFALFLGVIGYLTGNDVQSCIDKGHSAAVCYHTFGG